MEVENEYALFWGWGVLDVKDMFPLVMYGSLARVILLARVSFWRAGARDLVDQHGLVGD